MSRVENAAIRAYEKNRSQKPKYQTPDNFWMDWFKKGAGWAQNNQWISVGDAHPNDDENVVLLVLGVPIIGLGSNITMQIGRAHV